MKYAMMGHGMGMGHDMMMRGGMGDHAMVCRGMGLSSPPNANLDLSASTARDILEGRLAWQGNKRLKVGKVEAKDDDIFIASIVTLDDSLIRRIEVGRTTGIFRPVN